jgi:hypothetical protein
MHLNLVQANGVAVSLWALARHADIRRQDVCRRCHPDDERGDPVGCHHKAWGVDWLSGGSANDIFLDRLGLLVS